MIVNLNPRNPKASLTSAKKTTRVAMPAAAGGTAASQARAVNLINIESARRLNPFLDVISFHVVRLATSISVTEAQRIIQIKMRRCDLMTY